MNTFLFFRYGNEMLIFLLLLLLLFSKRVQILKTEYKYGQYCTPLTQSDCSYFFVSAITPIYPYELEKKAPHCKHHQETEKKILNP